MTIQLNSFNQLLGQMLRKILADTNLNDINAGSTLLTLMEAAASNDYENNVAILNVLELLNIDAVKNNDLDARAGDFGLSRITATRASGQVTLLNTNITKRSTGLYVIKPAPIAGQTKLFVNSTTGWAPTGSLYIGRGTDSFEGPINYTSITVFSTYSQINLGSALQKDHLISDSVVDSQGEPDRVIPSGTTVVIPANNQNPEILYTTLRDSVIPSGEDHVDGVDVIAVVPGSLGNAQINTITQYQVSPFNGAGVTNTSAFSNGTDVETDVELRNRIKSYSITLARGTGPAILASVIGVSDPDDSKQVASAVLTEPVTVGDPSILYIDDGSGFQPSFTGQSVDKLINNANGTEEFLQLANYPLPRPQVVNVADGPYTVIDGSFLGVEVDGKEETVFFATSDFLNSSTATTAEIVVAINRQSVTFKARFTNNSSNILLYPTDHSAETIRVSVLKATDDPTLYINSLLKFPTNEFSYIALYQNSTRLHEKQKSAHIETVDFASWNITTAGDIIISVDGTPSQDRSFALSDFPGISSFNALTLQNWVTAFNSKFAGLTATATPSETMIIQSNKTGDASNVTVTGGSYLNKWFPNLPLSSTGQAAQFQLNRQTGNLRILTDILPGDAISAGIEDAKGFVISTSTTSGLYNVASDSAGRPAEMVVVADSGHCVQRTVVLNAGETLDVTNPSGSVMRITSSALNTFASLLPGDFIFITSRTTGWLSAPNTGLFKIFAKGPHLTAGTDTYIDIENPNVVPEAGIVVADVLDIKAFSTDGYPQVWRGIYVSNPPAAPITDIVNSINTDLLGVKASVFKSNSIKITSTTEEGGSIAIPVAMGNTILIFAETAVAQTGNPSHLAHKVSDKSLFSMFKRTASTSANVWLNRDIYTDLKGPLSSASTPDSPPYSSTYSEIIQSTGVLTPVNVDYDDEVAFTRGNNRDQFRSIKAKIAGDEVGTQQGTARTALVHAPGDEFLLVRPIQLSTDDSMVVVMDKDSTNKAIDIRMSRTGKVNSGSVGSFAPTTTEFSADDSDNEPGINFSNLTVWGTTVNNTNFSDYSVWFRARNWYATGGNTSGQGMMLLRTAQYGPNGENVRFNIKHPSIPNQAASTFFVNTPSFSTFSYVFGSGAPRPTTLSAGDTIAVKGPYPNSSTNFPNGSVSTGNYFDYTFSAGNFAPVQVGDVLSIVAGSGVSLPNSGQFRVAAKSGNTLRVFNLTASNTAPGSAEVTNVTANAEVAGTPTQYVVTTTDDSGDNLYLEYFIIYDTAGSVAVWYDTNNTGAPPPPHGANRAIKVATVITGDSAATVATKTGQAIALDAAFTVGVISNQVTITNAQNGPLSSGSAGTTPFGIVTNAGTSDVTVDGKYFIIYDDVGSVAIWFDVGNDGTPEPLHGANRSLRVETLNLGDTATTVAGKIAAAVNLDPKFSGSSLGSVATITRTFTANVPASSAGTSGYGVADIDGSFSTPENISNPDGINVFPLLGTSVSQIVTSINASDLMTAVAIGNNALTIGKATVEDDYTYGGNSTALAYGHNPGSSDRDHVNMYDGHNWVKTFENVDPNFILKAPFTLNGVAPSVYSMDTAPNPGVADLGEFFKLIPVTVKNVYHQLTQKALSQLPIVSNINISNDRKNVQITSKQLGSQGSIEVIGGGANKAQAYIFGESELASDTSGNYLLLKIPAFPDTFNSGNIIKLENDAGVKRLSRLIATDTINVTNPSGSIIEYNYNPKAISTTSGTTFVITDVSASYSRPSGLVWRWTHGGGASFAQVKSGDLLMAFGTLAGWDQGNKSNPGGDGKVTGFPIINVNDSSNYIDVVNPHGKAMGSTAIGSSSTIQICPTPIIRWELNHDARVGVAAITSNGTTVTVTCTAPHSLNTGDSADIIDSDNLPDGTYTSVTATSSNVFTFAYVSSSFSEVNVGASVIKTGKVPTRYRIEKLGYNNLIRLSCQDGESPRFADCGVAVDDYIVIGGSTFQANNNGRFRVLAVDNSSIIMINSQATDELVTVKPFNNKSFQANWTANTQLVTGVAGTFKDVVIGSWVKKPEDPETYYRQVISFNPSTPASATSMTLGDNYLGATATAPGISYNEAADFDKGVILQNTSDIAVFEGDAVVDGDTLSVQNIIDTNWFSVGNIGSFSIDEIGVNSITFKPFIRVTNPVGVVETNRSMSVNLDGFYVVESLANKFYSFRQIKFAVLDDLNPDRRSIYVSPSNRSYKFSSSNNTSITHLGKLGYNTDIVTGIDGYLYYTGLLRRVQRIVDGYEPDAENFPGRRAVGSAIETLPPLIKRLSINVNVTTDEGVNLGDISNNIKSVVINYVETLGVGTDVILSEIIASIMQIKGVAAVTFTFPVPSTERITVASNEKATITPEDIGIA